MGSRALRKPILGKDDYRLSSNVPSLGTILRVADQQCTPQSLPTQDEPERGNVFLTQDELGGGNRTLVIVNRHEGSGRTEPGGNPGVSGRQRAG